MEQLLAVVVLAAVFGFGPAALVLLVRRVRRRGVGSGYSLMGPFDELWNPAALNARLDASAQEERPAPAPSPGDRLL